MPLTPPASSLRQRAAPSTAARRESPTPSQLDILAERNERFATRSPFARAGAVLAIVALILALIAVLWWAAQSGDPAAPGPAPMAVAPAAVDPLPLVAPTIANVAPAAETLPASAAAPAAAPSAVPAQAQATVPAPPSGERADMSQMRQARQAQREGDAPAKALPAPAQRQQRAIDKARDLAASTATAAETRSGAGPAAPGAEMASRPSAEAVAAGVREFCAARGNIVSELLCRTRECRKPERAKDAICLRLKEIEDAQRRVDSQ